MGHQPHLYLAYHGRYHHIPNSATYNNLLTRWGLHQTLSTSQFSPILRDMSCKMVPSSSRETRPHTSISSTTTPSTLPTQPPSTLATSTGKRSRLFPKLSSMTSPRAQPSASD